MSTKARPSKWAIISTIGAFLGGTILGSGAFWQWKQHELDIVVKTTELRKQENDLYRKIIDLSAEYATNMARYDQNNRQDSQAFNNMYRLKAQLDVLKDDFKVLESNLSRLESREPRTIPLEFIPPSTPTNLTGTTQ